MKWKELRHNGVAFPPAYEPKRLHISIWNETLRLSPDPEEMAYAWGKKITTPYVQDPVFQTNFLSDFVKVLPANFADVKYSEINFRPVYEYLSKEELLKSDKELKKKVAAQRKELRLQLKEKYGYAVIDGTKTEFANYIVEPPSIFMGRGSHPMRGRWKPRIFPEDVVLNLSEDAPVPPGKWKEIVHDHESIWLAYWVDKLSEVRKYVWPSDVSDLRQERDKMKYDKAKKLRRKLSDVREFIEKNLHSPDVKVRKLATVSYLIDNLAMRVGDEKEEDEADTVGASTLRVEHVKFLPAGVEFDFLGKDSVRWQKTLEVDSDKIVLENFLRFMNGKRPNDQIFDGISSEAVNRFLSGAMPGLTAKVFRTHQATSTVRNYLKNHSQFPPPANESEKLYRARRANLEAAIKCNHKRTPPKNWEESLVKKMGRLKAIEAQDPKTEKQAARRQERLSKLKFDVQLARETRYYNLNTSLRNYIDPRVYKSWSEHVGFDWTTIYSKSLQRKFQWANRARVQWEKIVAQ